MSEKKEKQRLDLLLVERGFYTGRDRAKAAVMAGEVMINGAVAQKVGDVLCCDCEITVRDKLRFVSRGGLKLERAIKVFEMDMKNKTVLDIGSSTGGFVDCALQNGAQKVISVDVGYGQLAWMLRQDARVQVFEKTNARYLTKEQVTEPVDMVTVDASFISLAKVLATPLSFLKEKGELAALIKPQFEAGRDKIGKKGVVRDKGTHIEVIQKVIDEIAALNMCVKAIDFSPITGPAGNIEYLLYALKCENENNDFNLSGIVDNAWTFHVK